MYTLEPELFVAALLVEDTFLALSKQDRLKNKPELFVAVSLVDDTELFW